MAPCSAKYSIVGIAATIRVSSVICPFSIGTLKSTRQKTFLPFISKSLIVLLCIIQLTSKIYHVHTIPYQFSLMMGTIFLTNMIFVTNARRPSISYRELPLIYVYLSCYHSTIHIDTQL